MRRLSRAAKIGADLEGQSLFPLDLDLQFVATCLQRIPVHAYDWAAEQYIAKWSAAAAEIHDHRKQNVGRRAANQWLRRVLEIKGLPVPGVEEIKRARV